MPFAYESLSEINLVGSLNHLTLLSWLMIILSSILAVMGILLIVTYLIGSKKP